MSSLVNLSCFLYFITVGPSENNINKRFAHSFILIREFQNDGQVGDFLVCGSRPQPVGHKGSPREKQRGKEGAIRDRDVRCT
jgi:hypothetical protein